MKNFTRELKNIMTEDPGVPIMSPDELRARSQTIVILTNSAPDELLALAGPDRKATLLSIDPPMITLPYQKGVFKVRPEDIVFENHHSGRDVTEAGADETPYEKFFASAMKKFGVSSPIELSPDDTKKFFNYVDKNWEAEEETDKDATEDVSTGKVSKKDKGSYQHAYKLALKKYQIHSADELDTPEERKGFTDYVDRLWKKGDIHRDKKEVSIDTDITEAPKSPAQRNRERIKKQKQQQAKQKQKKQAKASDERKRAADTAQKTAAQKKQEPEKPATSEAPGRWERRKARKAQEKDDRGSDQATRKKEQEQRAAERAQEAEERKRDAEEKREKSREDREAEDKRRKEIGRGGRKEEDKEKKREADEAEREKLAAMTPEERQKYKIKKAAEKERLSKTGGLGKIKSFATKLKKGLDYDTKDKVFEGVKKTPGVSKKPTAVGFTKQARNEVSPPDRKHQVKGIKKHLGQKGKKGIPKTYVDKKTGKRKETNPWALAWGQYDKYGVPSRIEKN